MHYIEAIKKQVDIIHLAKHLGFDFSENNNNRLRAKTNLLREENTSSLDFFIDTQKFYDRGEPSLKGDCIDLVSKLKNITQNEAVEWLKNDYLPLSNTNIALTRKESNNKPQESKKVDLDLLNNKAKELLSKSKSFEVVIIEKTNLKGELLDKYDEISINSDYWKLFETKTLTIYYEPQLSYIFNNLIGYSNFWNAPAIILKDYNQKIVDIAIYRPQKPSHFESWDNPKYIYKNFNNRGENWLYPFQYEMERLIQKSRICFIGEGLKNSLNALTHKIPFVSFESANNEISDKLKAYIEFLQKNKVELIGAFDGDLVGLKAYEKVKATIKIEFENIINFDSNLDFSNLNLPNVKNNFIEKISF